MPIARITGQGLVAIAFSVAFLWGCLIGERIQTRKAYTERTQVMRDLRRLRRDLPVSDPRPAAVQTPHCAL